jgi:hypothetical protein
MPITLLDEFAAGKSLSLVYCSVEKCFRRSFYRQFTSECQIKLVVDSGSSCAYLIEELLH